MVGRRVELSFAASSMPRWEGPGEKGELRSIQKSEGSGRPKNLTEGLTGELWVQVSV